MKTLILLLATGLLSVCLGFGHFDSMHNGTVLPGLSPTMAALGSPRALGLAEPVNVFTNPARLVLVPSSAQFSLSLISWTERVMESDIDLAVRTLNTYDNLSGAVALPVSGFTFGAGFAKVAEYGYEGTHEVRESPDDPVIGVEILTAEGGQWEGMAGISRQITGPLSAGFSGGLRIVKADYSYFFNSHDFQVPDSTADWTVDESEFAWHAGLALNGTLFTSGLSYSSATERMDEVVAFGATAFAEHLNDITVGFEGELVSPADNNHFLGKLSVVMPLTSSLNALTSASFDDQRIANRAGFGFGLGLQGEAGQLTYSAAILNRFKARKDTAFPNEAAERIDDSATQFSAGLVYRFGN